MNIQTFDTFKKQHAPPRTVKVSGKAFDWLCATLNLDSSSAEMPDVERELAKLAEAMTAKESGHSITSVTRGAPLAMQPAILPATPRRVVKVPRAAPPRRASTRTSR